MAEWNDFTTILADNLARVEAETHGRVPLDMARAFALWVEWTTATRARGGTAFFAGNGASASMACHFSADLAKNARVRTQVFTDPSLLTAIGNDICYADVFAEPLRWYGRESDLLITVSSSGNSPNVVRALEVAREKGLRSVALCAMRPDNASRDLADLCFFVPAATYGQAETAHGAILHHWMDIMESLPR
ncbi:SIS domain-containing protein [Desulfovibrio sp.]